MTVKELMYYLKESNEDAEINFDIDGTICNISTMSFENNVVFKQDTVDRTPFRISELIIFLSKQSR